MNDIRSPVVAAVAEDLLVSRPQSFTITLWSVYLRQSPYSTL